MPVAVGGQASREDRVVDVAKQDLDESGKGGGDPEARDLPLSAARPARRRGRGGPEQQHRADHRLRQSPKHDRAGAHPPAASVTATM